MIKILIKNVVKVIYKVVQRICMTLFCHKPHYNKRYNLVICGIFKNEAVFLKEWIIYHQIVGVEHFYLYNNNSTDNYREVLQEFVDDGTVTLIDWPHDQAQMEAYRDFYTRFRHESQWISFLDIDEFVVPHTDITILEWIKRHDSNPVNLVYWKMFGSSGLLKHDENKLVVEQYTNSWRSQVKCGKCFVNTDYDIAAFNPSTHHGTQVIVKVFGFKFKMYPVNQYGKICIREEETDIPNGKYQSTDIQINHYWSKGWNIYDGKRKFAGDVFFEENPKKKIGYFLQHETRNVSVDMTIYRYLLPLKWKMEGMNEYNEMVKHYGQK